MKTKTRATQRKQPGFFDAITKVIHVGIINNTQEQAYLTRLLEFSRAMCRGTAAIPLTAIQRGDLPEELKTRRFYCVFLVALAGELNRSKPAVAMFADQLFDNPGLAKSVASDSAQPAPIRQLALLIGQTEPGARNNIAMDDGTGTTVGQPSGKNSR